MHQAGENASLVREGVTRYVPLNKNRADMIADKVMLLPFILAVNPLQTNNRHIMVLSMELLIFTYIKNIYLTKLMPRDTPYHKKFFTG